MLRFINLITVSYKLILTHKKIGSKIFLHISRMIGYFFGFFSELGSAGDRGASDLSYGVSCCARCRSEPNRAAFILVLLENFLCVKVKTYYDSSG